MTAPTTQAVGLLCMWTRFRSPFTLCSILGVVAHFHYGFDCPWSHLGDTPLSMPEGVSREDEQRREDFLVLEVATPFYEPWSQTQ